MSSSHSPLHVVVVLGTRPEAIKLSPVVLELQRRSQARVSVVSTGQHREMLGPMLQLFGVQPDVDLDLQRHDQALEHVVITVLSELPAALERLSPDVLVVQGDTSTTFAASLAAFYRGVPVAHVEAGLRTSDPRNPFPEEMNRRLTSQLAQLHLAPTQRAYDALRAEGIPEDKLRLTGNTVVDALDWLRHQRGIPGRDQPPAEVGQLELKDQRMILITGHRRESFGKPMRDFCEGLRRVADEHADTLLVYPVHLNPKVQAPVQELLASHSRIRLLPPVTYPTILWLMEHSDAIITDSGGIQEEAPSFGVPVVVTREVTERMEAVDAGVSTLVGTDPDRIAQAVAVALERGPLKEKANPFGSGDAAQQTVDAILNAFG